MQAVMVDAYGCSGMVRRADVDRPGPGTGDVLVRVHALGVNPVDRKIRNGAGPRMA